MPSAAVVVLALFAGALACLAWRAGRRAAAAEAREGQARERAAVDMASSDARFRALTALSSDWYWEQDAEFRFTRIDGPRTQALAIAAPGQMIGKTRWEIGGLELTAEDWARHRAQLDRHEPFRDFVVKRTAASGTVVWQSISGDPMFDDQGRFSGYRGIGQDITARVRDQEHIERLAYHDALTGVPNRSLLQDRITQAVAQAQREKHSAAVLFLDLDHFKQINDSLGHDAGDAVLRECTRRLAGSLREADTVGRFGGDEFVVLLPEISGATDAAHVAAKLVATMRAPFLVAGDELHVGLSAGIALAPADGADAATLIRNADTAMYQAKQAGRNGFHFFTANLNADAARRLSLESDLRRGLERGEFAIAYQPQINLVTGGVTGVEALVRWQRGADEEQISPSEFIPVCEDIGVIHELGAWVLRAACGQVAAWQRAGLAPGDVAVNVSARQIHQPGFIAGVAAALRGSDLEPRRLVLEITESLMLDRREESLAILGQLRALGIKLSLDDFGTGYSSLSYLKRFPIDVIKIDQSFVSDVHEHERDAAMVEAILALALGLGLAVVAEGVETAAQADLLRAMGCPAAQGYFFASPLTVTACEAFLAAKGANLR
jgi:diguanylate cyclase (GGDEF)-like protein/PAS domain S-box-containing protein